MPQVADYTAFYRAEGTHQRYYKRNPNKAYCSSVITPKLAKFRRKFWTRLKRDQ